jgi:REP element-mobilizing transposase RayT
MARKLRIQFEGAIYHVAVRGNARQTIFLDDRDRERFLESLASAVETYGLRLYLFCLMTNHFHLLVETPQGNLSDFMGGLTTSYAVYFNMRHQRSGHLTQGRYGAWLVEGDEYLLRLSRYLHLNPVHVRGIKEQSIAERIKYLRSYRWSSLRFYTGQNKAGFLDTGPILAQVAERRGGGGREYRRFVEKGLVDENMSWSKWPETSPLGVGSETFLAGLEERYQKQVRIAQRREDVAFRHVGRRVNLEEVLQTVGAVFGVSREDLLRRRRDAADRAVAAQALVRFAGLSQRKVAEVLNMGSGSAVSQQIQRLKAPAPALADKLARLEQALLSSI